MGGGLVCSEEIRLTIQPTLTPALLPGLSALARRPTQQGAAAPISISWSAMGPAEAWRVPDLAQKLQPPEALLEEMARASQPLIRGRLWQIWITTHSFPCHNLSGAVVTADSVFSPRIP